MNKMNEINEDTAGRKSGLILQRANEDGVATHTNVSNEADEANENGVVTRLQNRLKIIIKVR